MEVISIILVFSQFIFTIVVGLYFYINLRSQQNSKNTLNRDFKNECDHIKNLRKISLTKPLGEKTRPNNFEDIIGQEKGIKALKAAICGPNPQHVIIYGPPGVGKTAAARVVLDYATKSSISPFKKDSPFIEIDATILQFDERSIADPLIGSVHDPIYQGSGIYGQSGIPQPKEGAVTKAHGGILFIDEIGELQNMQMNKLLKVLEDRKVILNSSYYSKQDSNIPMHIHDIFKNGLPADFRLIGATTRRPDEMPQALRSRCSEIFFRGLRGCEIETIASNAFNRAGFKIENEVLKLISKYCENGRDTVNIVQMSVSIATLEKKDIVTVLNVEEVLEFGRYNPKISNKVPNIDRIGTVNGLALYNLQNGTIMEVEAIVKKTKRGELGKVQVSGIVQKEEINSINGKMIRQSSAMGSINNALLAVDKYLTTSIKDYDIYLNFPGGIPVDGPSAGISIFTAIYSSIKGKKITSKLAMTGEINLKGEVLPVGGVAYKIEAAIEAGIETVLIPKDSWQTTFNKYSIKIICLETVVDLINQVFNKDCENIAQKVVLTAKGVGNL